VYSALQTPFGLPGCAEQSVLAETLDAATDVDVATPRQVVEASFIPHRQARRHDFDQAVLVLDVARSPLATSQCAEGATRGYIGRCRSKTGRKPVWVRAAVYQDPVGEEVLPDNTVESSAVLEQAVVATERLLGIAAATAAARARRARLEFRRTAAGAAM
jgi:hypothetical protein